MATRNTSTYYLLIIFTMLWCSQALATPSAFTAKYKASYSGFNINATRTLSCEAELCTFKSVAKAKIGHIEEESKFNLVNGAITPLSYRYYQKFFLSKRKRSLEFEHDAKKALYKDRKGTKTISYSTTAYDPMSYQYMLAQMILSGKNNVDIPIISRGKLKIKQFEVVGKETFTINNKPVETIKIEQIRKQSSSRSTTIWIAPAWDGLIVKLDFSKDGDTHHLVLQSVTFPDAVQ